MKDVTLKDHPETESLIGWVPENDGVFIALQENRCVRFSIEDAVLWDLLHRFSEQADLVAVASAVFKVSTHEAEELLLTKILEWKHEGLLK